MDKIKLLYYIGLCVGVGIVASFFTQSSVDTWFLSLEKPWFNPPSWIFAPVWTILYILMGISAYMVNGKNTHVSTKALKWFYVQLVLNFLWSFSFFYLRNPVLGLANILLLLVSIIVMVSKFNQVSRLAALLQIPYIGWVVFASVLNYSIYSLN